MNPVTEFGDLLRLIDDHLIKGMFISVLLIVLSRVLLKNKQNYDNAMTIVKYILIANAVLSLNFFMVNIFFSDTNEFFALINRATGPYWFSFWIMLLTRSIFPFALLNERIAANIYFLFFLTIFMNIAWLFESYILHMMSIHSDYIPGINGYLPFQSDVFNIVRGVTFGALAVILGNVISFYKLKKSIAHKK